MYAVEGEFIDHVIWQYSPCKSLRRCLRCTSHPCLATKVGAIIAGQTSVKAPEKAASTRCPHCLLALAPQTYCFPGWPAIGPSLVTALSQFHTSYLSSSRLSSSTVPQMKAPRLSRAYSTVSNHATSTSPTRITTSPPPTFKWSLTLPSSHMFPSFLMIRNILMCLMLAWVQCGLPNTRIPGNKASMLAVSKLSRSTSCFVSIPTNGTSTLASLS